MMYIDDDHNCACFYVDELSWKCSSHSTSYRKDYIAYLYRQLCHCNHMVLQFPILESSSLPHLYLEVCCKMRIFSPVIYFFGYANYHRNDWMIRLTKIPVNNVALLVVDVLTMYASVALKLVTCMLFTQWLFFWIKNLANNSSYW